MQVVRKIQKYKNLMWVCVYECIGDDVDLMCYVSIYYIQTHPKGPDTRPYGSLTTDKINVLYYDGHSVCLN